MPYSRQDEDSAGGNEAKEEDYNYGMLVVHKAVGEAVGARCNAAISESDIKAAKKGRYVENEKAVEEAYGRVPVLINTEW